MKIGRSCLASVLLLQGHSFLVILVVSSSLFYLWYRLTGYCTLHSKPEEPPPFNSSTIWQERIMHSLLSILCIRNQSMQGRFKNTFFEVVSSVVRVFISGAIYASSCQWFVSNGALFWTTLKCEPAGNSCHIVQHLTVTQTHCSIILDQVPWQDSPVTAHPLY